jgi:hypothetical protein
LVHNLKGLAGNLEATNLLKANTGLSGNTPSRIITNKKQK